MMKVFCTLCARAPSSSSSSPRHVFRHHVLCTRTHDAPIHIHVGALPCVAVAVAVAVAVTVTVTVTVIVISLAAG
jgi:hypothetical protein